MVVSLDLDGTCTNISWRILFGGKEPSKRNVKKYNEWLSKVQSEEHILQDAPVAAMRELAISLKKHAVYVTSRQEKFRKVTEQWLKYHKFPKLKLIMREDNNYDTCADYKERVILELLKNKKGPVLIIDDDSKGDIEKMAKRNGWTFLKARSGR